MLKVWLVSFTPISKIMPHKCLNAWSAVRYNTNNAYNYNGNNGNCNNNNFYNSNRALPLELTTKG